MNAARYVELNPVRARLNYGDSLLNSHTLRS